MRSSHHFLTEADIDFFRPLVRSQYLPSVQLYLVRNDAGHVAAFMGLSDDMVEMLFVLPAEQGKGCGSLLLDYAVHTLGITCVDVNEDNTQAYGFYLHKGFTPVGRDATDPFGKPFPIIRLRYCK